MNWLILIFLVPLALIPVVFLTGFVGCSFEPGRLPPTVVEPPSGLKAEAVSSTQIDLSWKDNAPAQTTSFRINRLENGTPISPLTPDPNGAVDQTLSDPGRMEGTLYEYQVFALILSEESIGSNSATATTLFRVYDVALTTDDSAFPANTLFTAVQIIPSANLLRSGSKIRITLRSASAAQLAIDKVFISQGALAGNVYDAGPDLTEVLFAGSSGVTIPANEVRRSDETNYAVDQTKNLLIAFNISNTNGSVRRGSLSTAGMHSKANASEAQLQDRSPGYTAHLNEVYIVEKIEGIP